jgi:hypothetical protein
MLRRPPARSLPSRDATVFLRIPEPTNLGKWRGAVKGKSSEIKADAIELRFRRGASSLVIPALSG